MSADWYYIENNKTFGPTTLDDLIRRIKQTGRPRLVWTEGLSDWTNSNEISDLIRPEKPSLSARLRKEMAEYLAITAYLFVCIGSILFFKASVLGADGIEFAPFGLAVIKSLILGKFILVLHALRIGERKGGTTVLLINIFKKSLLFAILLIVLSIGEELIAGYFHGRTNQQVFSELAGGTLQQAFATSILMLLILVPYFAFREIGDRLGEGTLWRLLTSRISAAAR